MTEAGVLLEHAGCCGHTLTGLCMPPPMQVNLIAGRCKHGGCNVIAWYGYHGQNRRFCNRHKLAGMVGSQRTLKL